MKDEELKLVDQFAIASMGSMTDIFMDFVNKSQIRDGAYLRERTRNEKREYLAFLHYSFAQVMLEARENMIADWLEVEAIE